MMMELLIPVFNNFWWNFFRKFIIFVVWVIASYTYGPLLGLFVFGIFSKRKLLGRYIFIVVILSPILTYFLSLTPTLYALQIEDIMTNCKSGVWDCAKNYAKDNFYNFGYELLPINGILTLIGLYSISKK